MLLIIMRLYHDIYWKIIFLQSRAVVAYGCLFSTYNIIATRVRKLLILGLYCFEEVSHLHLFPFLSYARQFYLKDEQDARLG